MTINLPPKVVSRSGMSLLELTIAISVLLGIIAITFVGTRAWKRGSDRATCILSLRNIQMATRCYQNLYGYDCGGRPNVENGTRDIASHLLEKGYIERKLYGEAKGANRCPSGGTYTRLQPDVFPEIGELYMQCSLSAADSHEPTSHAQW